MKWVNLFYAIRRYPFELYGSYISVTRLSKSAIHNTNSKENTNLEDHESESTYRLVVSLPTVDQDVMENPYCRA